MIAYGISYVFPHVYIPGTIIGMVILLAFLIKKFIKLNQVDEVGTFLTNNMAFFFIPAAVSVIGYLDILRFVFVKIIIVCIISIVISFVMVAYSVKITLSIQAKIAKKRGQINE
jgi:holin-like protein